ncbi:MAG: ABC transporter ATP-binding protein/permease, partial [Flavobacteriaceae bacterium]
MNDEEKRAARRDGAMLSTLADLWPYIWPANRSDLKARAILALVLLVVAKLVTVLVPYAFKWSVDALTDPAKFAAGVPPVFLLVAGPLALVTGYNVGRVSMVVLAQIRDAIFARVGQHAVRVLANKTFRHLHGLSLRFHLERRTGGLNRVIERGTKGIETIVRFTILSTIPTILEFVFVAIVVSVQFDLTYLAVLGVTVVVYLWFTVWMSERRIAIRRLMNDSDTDANAKAVDSLLNFETVKYFGNEAMEAARFDRSMERYEDAAIRTWTSLSWLNSGQTVIFSAGMLACMLLSANAVLEGRQTLGDFVMINALLVQLYVPLNFIGMVYREIKQSLVDIETMFDLLDREPEIADRPGAKPLAVKGGEIVFDEVDFHYDPSRPILRKVSFTVPAGNTVAIVGPSGAGKSTISRILYRFYDIAGGKVTVDGQDIRDVTQESLRAAIGMVPQDTVLFNDTIRYNIRYGRPGASDEEVVEAARLAQIAPVIEALPEGVDTPVG